MKRAPNHTATLRAMFPPKSRLEKLLDKLADMLDDLTDHIENLLD